MPKPLLKLLEYTRQELMDAIKADLLPLCDKAHKKIVREIFEVWEVDPIRERARRLYEQKEKATPKRDVGTSTTVRDGDVRGISADQLSTMQ